MAAVDLATSPREGLIYAKRRLAKALRTAAPPPRLLISEWADRYRMLPSVSSAEPGRWRTDRAPYQREPMDAILDPEVEIEVLIWGSQNGKTEILNNACGYFIDQDPAPMLVVQPTEALAEAWSKERLQPTIDDTPRLREKVKPARSRDSGNTILSKSYPGGHLAGVGANAPSGLASRPRRIVLGDEIDRWPRSAGQEGNVWTLAWARTTTFWNRKGLITSTPTIKGLSEVEKWFERSDQREFHVPCPHCDEFQVLKWKTGKDESERFHLVYDRDEFGEVIPDSAAYCCQHCAALIREADKPAMLARGVWIAKYPERRRIRGYHLSTLYSPWKQWHEIASQWERAKGDAEELKVFVNTILAETWEERGESLDTSALSSRLEEYEAEVPAGAALLTCAVDVQDTWLEAKVKAWGAGEESWLIAHQQFHGDPAKEGPGSVWDELDRFRKTKFDHASGEKLSPVITVIDSGGHHTDTVYRYAKVREAERVYAIKGASKPGAPVVSRPTANNRYRAKLFVANVDAAKEKIHSRLKMRAHGAGYIHLPIWADDEYLDQLTAEKAIKKYRKGFGSVLEWVKLRPRNEAFDLEVYSLVALYILGETVIRSLGERAAALMARQRPGGGSSGQAGGGGIQLPPDPNAPRPGGPPRPRGGGGWVGGWRR